MKKLTVKALEGPIKIDHTNVGKSKLVHYSWIAKSRLLYDVYKEFTEKGKRQAASRMKILQMAKDFIKYMEFVENRMIVDKRPIPLNPGFYVFPAITIIDNTLLRKCGKYRLKRIGKVKRKIFFISLAIMNRVNQMTKTSVYGMFDNDLIKNNDIFEMQEAFIYQPRKKPLKNEKRSGNI